VNVQGGAVDFAWAIHDSVRGQSVSCEEAGIKLVQLDLAACPSGVCPTTQPPEAARFDCTASRATTFFNVPPGPTEFAIELVCADASIPSATRYSVPQPIVRVVENGEVTELDDLLITVPGPSTATGQQTKCPWP